MNVYLQSMETAHLSRNKNTVLTLVLLFLLLIPCYSNSFNASWQLDDRPNIIDNRRLHIDNLMPSTLWNTFSAKPGEYGSLYRPIANLSFALNWYLGKDNPIGYHVANFSIHLATTIILYATFLLLFSTPATMGRFGINDSRFIAALGAALWAINPIHTQAVTYIVQRMAILAALFYILGIFLYLKGRLIQERSGKIIFFTGCLLSYLLAVGSKENAIMLPVSLLLTELVFFRDTHRAHHGKTNILWAGAAIFLFICFAIMTLVKFDGLDFLLNGYQNRPFSMPERLMTEARIVIWYIGLIFYPSPHRLSVAHDVTLSTSLASPWTTLPAMLTIAALVVLALWRIKKNAFLSFGILFFLINHIVESSILPLELIFEHRNYLPSMFLFLPVAAGIQLLLEHETLKSRTAYHLMVAFVPLLLIALSWSTYYRNAVWQTEKTLWEDAMAKAPKNARPLTTLADVLAAGNNPPTIDLDRALGFYFKSLQLDKARNDIEPMIMGNMADLYVKKQELSTAIQLYQKTIERYPNYARARYNLSVLLGTTGQLDAANREIDRILNAGYMKEDYYNLKGTILMWEQQPEAALVQFKKALRLTENKAKPFIGIGSALCDMGYHRQAEWFLRLAHKAQPDAIVTLLLLIENALNADNPVEAEQWTQRLLNEHSLPTIKTWLDRLPTFYQMPPVSVDRVAATIYDRASALPDTIKPMK